MISFYLVIFASWLPIYYGKIYNKNKVTNIGIFILIMLSSLRYKLGVDYYSYYIIFNRYKEKMYVAKKFEKGFEILNKVISYYGLHFNFTLFITSSIFIILVFISYRKIDRNLYHLYFLIFLLNFQSFFVGISSNRQGVALGILIFSIKYIIEKKFLKFLILICIGFLFHKSIILFIPIYFLVRILKNKKQLIIISILNLLLLLSIDTIALYILQLAKLTKYSYFFGQDLKLGSGLGVLVRILWLGILIWNYDNINKRKKKYYVIYIIGTLISFWALKGINIQRILVYFYILTPIPIFLIIQRLRYKKILTYVVMMFYVLNFGVNYIKIQNTGSAFQRESWKKYKLIIFENDNLKRRTDYIEGLM